MNDNGQEVAARLIITIFKNGTISLEGPVHDAILCFGLMEAAKDAVRAGLKKQRESHIVVPQVRMVPQGGKQ